jgi:RNA polymerase sigma factor (sigma-70 family)
MDKERVQAKSEAALLQLFCSAKEGADDARNALMTRLYPAVSGFVRARLAATPELQNWHQDLVQEGMLRISTGIWRCEFKDDAALIGWCLTVARHASTDYVRHNVCRAVKLVALADAAAQLAHDPSDASTPHTMFPSDDHRFVLNAILDGLDDEQQAVLWHHVVDGSTWAEIGLMLRISAGAAKRRWQRLSKGLKAQFAVGLQQAEKYAVGNAAQH